MGCFIPSIVGIPRASFDARILRYRFKTIQHVSCVDFAILVCVFGFIIFSASVQFAAEREARAFFLNDEASDFGLRDVIFGVPGDANSVLRPGYILGRFHRVGLLFCRMASFINIIHRYALYFHLFQAAL